MKKNDKTIEETFALAFKKHQENKLHLAEKLYKEIQSLEKGGKKD